MHSVLCEPYNTAKKGIVIYFVTTVALCVSGVAGSCEDKLERLFSADVNVLVIYLSSISHDCVSPSAMHKKRKR